MKENNVWLSADELQHMLQGSIQWRDVEGRIGESSVGIRKLGDVLFEKESTPLTRVEQEPLAYEVEEVAAILWTKSESPKRINGRPVIWLLGSLGLTTLFLWFYFVLFNK